MVTARAPCHTQDGAAVPPLLTLLILLAHPAGALVDPRVYKVTAVPAGCRVFVLDPRKDLHLPGGGKLPRCVRRQGLGRGRG